MGKPVIADVIANKAYVENILSAVSYILAHIRNVKASQTIQFLYSLFPKYETTVCF